MRRWLLLIALLAAITGAFAQTLQPQESQKTGKKGPILVDTLDHKLDFSNYLINMHGFIPWPSIISEPALGDFGLAMALVFISPSASQKAKANYTFPDITAVAGMWTLNNSWGVAALRQGSFPKIGMRYRVALGYAPLNVEFYRTINTEFTGEKTKSFLFNLKSIFTLVEASENIWKNKVFLGMNYTFASTQVNYEVNIGDTLRRIIEYFQLDTLFDKK